MIGVEADLAGIGDQLAVHIAAIFIEQPPLLHGPVHQGGKLPVVAVLGDLRHVVEDQSLLAQVDAGLNLLGVLRRVLEAVFIEILPLGVPVGGPGVVHAVLRVPQIAAVEIARVDRHVRVALIALAAVQEDVAEGGQIGQGAHGHGVEVRQGLPVVLGVDHVHTILRRGDQTLEEHRGHKAPLGDQGRVVVSVKDSEDAVGRLVLRMLGGVVVVENQPVPVVEAGIGHRVDKGGGVEGVQAVFVPLGEHKGLALHDGDGGQA